MHKRETHKRKKIKLPSLSLVGTWIIVFGITFCFLYAYKLVTTDKMKMKLGITAVQDMYQFMDTAQLKVNMIDLQAITTEPVYNQLTIDNENRTLYTYVKFRGDPTSVNIIKSTADYVIYSIDNDSIDEDRRFVFMFDCDSSGKISHVREAELYDFTSYYD